MHPTSLKFIDLFAGLGGFHIALQKVGHACVFACEIKEDLAQLYEDNFSIVPHRDITNIRVEDIPEHDILCAGFPCQPFSKAGKQHGLQDKRNGSLFDRIVHILTYHKPKYFILENVRNLESHDNGKTWAYIASALKDRLGYEVDKRVLSPHQFGIPQHRERFFIVGAREGLAHFGWPVQKCTPTDVRGYLERSVTQEHALEESKVHVLDVWQSFLDALPASVPLPSFPIWSMEWEATYPFEARTPHSIVKEKLAGCTGSFGNSLQGLSKQAQMKCLPSYARYRHRTFPEWKKRYIRQNRDFYHTHKQALAPVLERIKCLPVPSWQKFEWNVQKAGSRRIRDYIVQFRGSGVRVKKTDFFPSLVTVSTQIPIIGWQERYITPKEGARLQHMENIKLPRSRVACFRALGNAVNTYIIEEIVLSLCPQELTKKAQIGHRYATHTFDTKQ